MDRMPMQSVHFWPQTQDRPVFPQTGSLSIPAGLVFDFQICKSFAVRGRRLRTYLLPSMFGVLAI
jgi:hypothetical protein